MSTSRIYISTDADGNARLIKANNQPQALRYMARKHFAIAPATGIQVAEAMSTGARVEDATKEVEEPQP